MQEPSSGIYMRKMYFLIQCFFTCLSGNLKPWLFSASKKIIRWFFFWNVSAIALETTYLPQSGSLKEPKELRLSFYQERKLEAQGQKLHWAVEKTRERSPKCKTKWIWEELLPPKRSSSLVALGLPRMLQLPLLTMKLVLWGIHMQTTKSSPMNRSYASCQMISNEFDILIKLLVIFLN